MPTVRSILNPEAKIFVVGEAPGAEEEKQGLPFVGPSGQELDLQLKDVGLTRKHLSISNVFQERPPNNILDAWAEERKIALRMVDPSRPWAIIPCKKGILPPTLVQPALERLRAEILTVRPNVVVAMGNTPLAALTGMGGITKARGALAFASLVPGLKVIPTYHPAYILRKYEDRIAVLMDWEKIKLHSESPTADRLINRRIYVSPTKDDLPLMKKILTTAERLSIDIETKKRQITCISFSPTKQESYVIPFWLENGTSYWSSVAEEALAWRVVQAGCESSAIKIFQNGIYDVQYLFRMGIAVRNFTEDTMILQHSLYPSLPKGLDFLGSLYCDEFAWKRMRRRAGETQELKRGE